MSVADTLVVVKQIISVIVKVADAIIKVLDYVLNSVIKNDGQ